MGGECCFTLPAVLVIVFAITVISSHRSMIRKFPDQQIKPSPPGPMP